MCYSDVSLTIPQALQLYFFRIMEKGWPHSMHLVMLSGFKRRGCSRPISWSRGFSISRPTLSEDFLWYSSLMVWKSVSSHSSFSSRVLELTVIGA